MRSQVFKQNVSAEIGELLAHAKQSKFFDLVVNFKQRVILGFTVNIEESCVVNGQFYFPQIFQQNFICTVKLFPKFNT